MTKDLKDLFYACGGFRDALFHFLVAREQMYHRYELIGSEKERIMDFERERVRSKFFKLKEIIEECEEELLND